MNMSPFAWYLVLLAVGMLLIIAEVFLPGGAAGVLGGLALLAAMALGLAKFPEPWGFLSAVAIVVFGGIALLLWIQLFPRSRVGKRIALNSDGASFKAAAPAASVGIHPTRNAGGADHRGHGHGDGGFCLAALRKCADAA